MTTIETMKDVFLNELKKFQFDLIAISDVAKDRKNDAGEVTGKERFVKLTVEVPRGNGGFSRLRFDVKVPEGTVKITQTELECTDYTVELENLTISFLDTTHGRVYFRADDYVVKEE
mgnify:CR=1 FL=1